VSKPKGWRPLTEAEKQEIVARYTAGETMLTLLTEYRRAKPIIRAVLQEAGVAIRPAGYPKGTVWSNAHREAHRKATSTPEFAEKSRQTLIKRLPTMRGPATNTAIEQRMHDALMKAGIGFTTQSALLDRYLVDIELHQARVVIEADGAQHTLREQKAKDAIRDEALTIAGYRIFRFTGGEINRDAAACVRTVIDACGLTPDQEPVYEIRTRFAGPAHPLWKGGKQEFTCEQCGTVFLAQPKHRSGKHVYCNRQCANDGKRGQKLTEEHRAKVAAGLTGIKRGPLTAETKAKMGAGVSAALKGKPKTAEHAAKVAAAHKGKPKSAETRAKISATLKARNATLSD